MFRYKYETAYKYLFFDVEKQYAYLFHFLCIYSTNIYCMMLSKNRSKMLAKSNITQRRIWGINNINNYIRGCVVDWSSHHYEWSRQCCSSLLDKLFVDFWRLVAFQVVIGHSWKCQKFPSASEIRCLLYVEHRAFLATGYRERRKFCTCKLIT